jgi:hypothetical protein
MSPAAIVAPLWKQSLGSTIHCVAGDATGIVLAAIITTSIGLPMWGETIVEYAAGFGFGLLVFQALFMRDMLGGGYLAAVKSTVLPEWLSMNCVMAGMVVVMVIIRTHSKGTTDVSDIRFWGVLSLAVLTGLAVAYPVNVWLVANELKHGMGTVLLVKTHQQRNTRPALQGAGGQVCVRVVGCGGPEKPWALRSPPGMVVSRCLSYLSSPASARSDWSRMA